MIYLGVRIAVDQQLRHGVARHRVLREEVLRAGLEVGDGLAEQVERHGLVALRAARLAEGAEPRSERSPGAKPGAEPRSERRAERGTEKPELSQDVDTPSRSPE